MFKEFKAFILRGNVIDLAIGVIIGAAFNKIVSSFIDDVITPLLLKPALDSAGLTELTDLKVFNTVKYGNFLSNVLSFVIVAFVLFIIVKIAHSAKKKEEAKPAAIAEVPADVKLLTEIRDLLKKGPQSTVDSPR
jgi:large conductance mechanosensitive channel